MNLIDETVKEVLEGPTLQKHADRQWWAVKVSYISWGRTLETEVLTFQTEEQAKAVKPGFVFLH